MSHSKVAVILLLFSLFCCIIEHILCFSNDFSILQATAISSSHHFQKVQQITNDFTILFDTTYLGSGDNSLYTCTATNQRIYIGNPAAAVFDCTILGSGTEWTDCYIDCPSSKVTAPSLLNGFSAGVAVRVQNYIRNYFTGSKLFSSLSTQGWTVPMNQTTYCGTTQRNVVIPANYNSTASFTDMTVLLTNRPMEPSRKTSIEICASDNQRPILVYLNLDPSFWYLNADSQTALVSQQIVKVMGFDSKFYTVATTTRTFNNDQRVIPLITNPQVISVARQFYGCNTLTQVPLEENDEMPYLKVKGNYWEKRVFNAELMVWDPITNKASVDIIISPMTLALVQSIGWYQAKNIDSAMITYSFGRSLGCDFLSAPCRQFNSMGNTNGLYYCDTSTVSGCNYDLTIKSPTCNIRQFQGPLPNYYQQVSSDSTKGSESIFADRCPMMEATASADCRVFTNAPTDADRFGEKYGTYSRCMSSSVVTFDGSTPSYTSRCYEHACENGTALYIRVGNAWITCPKEGGVFTDTFTLTGSEFIGEIVCPKTSILCPFNYTSPNFNEGIRNYKANVDNTGWNQFIEWLKTYHYIVWVSAIVLLLIAVAIAGVVIVIVIVRVSKGRKWKTTRTVDVEKESMQMRDMQH